MRILATNDDGVYADGLWVLAEHLRNVGQVVVMAPDREQSGTGTAVTLHQPVRISRIRSLVAGVDAYSVEGTPSDAVILALAVVGGIDLVVSGINPGPNLGDDVLISGTVGAAWQGYFRGIPAIALSIAALDNCHFEAAARVAEILVGKLNSGSLPREVLLNINVPNLPLSELKGVELTHLAQRSYADSVSEGHDGRRRYYWIVRGESQWNLKEGSDIWALKNNKVSVTPLQSDLTAVSAKFSLQNLRSDLIQGLGQD